MNSKVKDNKIGILGAGSWGNTLAYLLGQNKQVVIWDYKERRAKKLQEIRHFKKPIVKKYPDNVEITGELKDLFDCSIIINTIPVKGIHKAFEQLKDLDFPKDIILVNGSKGVEPKTLKTPTEIIKTFCPDNPVAVISGPNLAKEIIDGKPMVTVVASPEASTSQKVQEILTEPTLRVYTNTDMRGVELAGALKNVIALAAGCVDGLELGHSAKASLITRGLAEIRTLINLQGGDAQTAFSAAGIGDLVATCASNLSRNYRVGYFMAKGESLENVIKKLGEVAEGVNTTYAVYKISQEKKVPLPIVEQIKNVLDEKITPVDAVLYLMNRPVGSE